MPIGFRGDCAAMDAVHCDEPLVRTTIVGYKARIVQPPARCQSDDNTTPLQTPWLVAFRGLLHNVLQN